MSSTIRKRKRDGVTSVQDDEVVKVKHKKPRRRKSQPQRNAEGQDEHAVPKLKEVSKFDELPSDAERKGSATESAQQTTSKKANRSKKKHDKRKKHAQGREQPQEKTQEQREEGQAEAEGQAREHRTGTSRKRKHAVSVDPTWNISQALGGRVIDADPVVTDDEKYVVHQYQPQTSWCPALLDFHIDFQTKAFNSCVSLCVERLCNQKFVISSIIAYYRLKLQKYQHHGICALLYATYELIRGHLQGYIIPV